MKNTILLTLGVLLASTDLGLSMVCSSGELTSNGDFELGDTSSWEYFPSANSSFSVTNDANGGTFGAELINDQMGSAALVKQANLGIGLVSPGDTVTISFAAKGTFGIGGVAFAEFFSELNGGGTSSSEILSGGPLNLSANWQTFSFTTVAGPDVSGGVTLQLVAVTGAIIGSTAALSIDDASVSIDAGGAVSYCVSGTNNDGEQCTIGFSGSASIAANDLELVATDVSSFSQHGLFVMGDTQTQVPFGQGFLCVTPSGQFHRLAPTLAYSNQNVVTRAVDNTTGPGTNLAAGATWNFQFWYRDAGSTNLSDAISLCFVP